MPVKPITQLGKAGVIKDLPPTLLPENCFTDALNVRFINESVTAMKGESLYKLYTTVVPEYGIHWRRPDQGYNVLANDGIIVRSDAAGGESFMLNSADAQYTDSVWQTDTFNGGYSIIFNNGKSTPLYALYGHPTAGSTLQEFPGWNYLAGLTVTAKVVRNLNYSLVAANLTLNQSGTITYAPSTIRVSVQAPTGGFPQIWQPGTTTDTADEFEINSTSPILDLAELRGNMYVYSSDSIHVLSIKGGTSVVQPYAKGYGILNTNCVVEFDGRHFVVDRNDIYTHAGSGKPESLINKRNRDFFYSDLNKEHANKVFVFKNVKYKEIWVCYPSGVSTSPTKALIYNYVDDNWTFRTLPNPVSHLKTYSTNGSTFNYSDECNVLTIGSSSRTLKLDDTYQMYVGGGSFSVYDSYVIREKYFSGNGFETIQIVGLSPVVDLADNTVEFTITAQNNFTNPADFSNASTRDLFVFEPNNLSTEGYRLSPRKKGRVINYKIKSQGSWRLSLLGIDAVAGDQR